MPCHKGVEISVISQWELSIHPEFAHPDSSQFKRSPNLDHRESLLPAAAAVASESKADQLLGRQSAVSVYIPSLSGTRFWLRYRVMEPERTLCYLWYFKFYMNGRHITSWGINTNKTSGGQVMRALYDPSARWNYKDKGVLFKNNGTEARPFFFNNEAEARSAAIDGGLLEVRVFRAKGRKRRVADPEEFKAQDRYGITMPTGGLLEKPQDAKFYDYFLIDPKDKPYATFRFHYRTWDHLEALQLLPTDHPRTLIPTTPSLMSMNGQSRSLQDVDDQDWETIADVISPSVISPSKASPSSNKSSPSHTTWLTDVFDDSPKLTDANIEKNISSPTAPDSPLMLGMQRSRSIERAFEDPKRRIPMSKFFQAVDDNFMLEQQTKSWIESLDRPLPEIPTRSTSLPKDSSECPSPLDSHSRKSSAASHAPSIAHSLLGYADRESSYSPEPVLGVASVVPIVRSPSEEIMRTFSSPRSDEDQYTQRKFPSHSEKSENVRTTDSPKEAVILTPNVTIRKHKRSPNTPMSPSKGRSIHDDDNSTLVSLTESEWMCRTPSPVKNEPNHVRLSKLWSPGVDKHKSSTPRQGSALRKKALDWYGGSASPGQETGNGSPSFRFDDSNEVKIRSGNWI